MSIIHFSHEQPFQLRDLYPSAVQFEHAGVLQAVKDPRHIETTVADFLGQALHQNMEGLGTCGIEGVLEEEAHDSFTERLRTATPLPLDELLRLCGIVVDKIQAENQEVFGESDNLFFVEGEEVYIRQSIEVTSGPGADGRRWRQRLSASSR